MRSISKIYLHHSASSKITKIYLHHSATTLEDIIAWHKQGVSQLLDITTSLATTGRSMSAGRKLL
jgi:hypothetical protein